MLVGGTEVLHLGNIKFDAPPNNSEGASCHGGMEGWKDRKTLWIPMDHRFPTEYIFTIFY
jgi:hypothetical protein